MERGNKTTVRTGRGDAIEMKGWMGGNIVRAVFVNIVCDCPVGLLYLVESKTGTKLAHVCECVGVRRRPYYPVLLGISTRGKRVSAREANGENAKTTAPKTDSLTPAGQRGHC